MAEQNIDQNVVEEEITYCEVHPDRETGLRCNKCERYMCAQCAVQTPIGYRCRECVRQVEDKFYKGTQQDYVVGFAVAVGISIIAGAIASALGFILFSIILGLPVGGAISEAVMRSTERRRGRLSAEITAAAVVIGGFLGGAVRAFLTYPDEAREIHRRASEGGFELPPQVLAMYPTLSTYITENTLSIALIIFVAAAAFAAYSRIKM